MKLLLFLCMPLLIKCSSGPRLHSELNTAIKDLTKAPTAACQTNALVRINMAILGGSKLERTDYSLADITNVISKDELEGVARENDWFGIQLLLGINKIFIKKEDK